MNPTAPEAASFRRQLPPPIASGGASAGDCVRVELYHLGDIEMRAAHAEHLVSLQLAPVKLYQRRGNLESQQELARGSVVITPAGEPKTWRREGEGDLLVVALPPRLLDRCWQEVSGRSNAQVRLRDVFGTRDAQLEALALGLWQELRDKSLGSELYADALVRQLTLVLLRRYCDRAPAAVNGARMPVHKVRQVQGHVEAHLGEDLSVERLARVAGMSPFHFAHAFRQATGQAPHAYVMQQRMERARALLAGSNLTLEEIAGRVGYSSQSHFSAAFRKIAGTPPSVLRKRS